MEIYLYRNEMFTGETFRSHQEVADWVAEQLGEPPDAFTRMAIRMGRHFQIGGDWYHCLSSEESMEALAA